MSQLLTYLLDLFFPKKSLYHSNIHSYLSKELLAKAKLKARKVDFKTPHYLEKIFFCLEYWPEVQDLLQRAKFEGEFAIIYDLAKLVFEVLKKDKEVNFDCSLLTFVPPDPQRGLQRGYHLPKLLALDLAKKLKITCLDLTYKVFSTPSQSLLQRDLRLKNLVNVFKLKPVNLDLNNFEKIYILDDVLTTGTTLNEVAKTIKTNYTKIKIYGLTIASARK